LAHDVLYALRSARQHACAGALALVLLAPGLAEACPNCIGNSRFEVVLRMVGVFMLLPFVLFALVVRAIRRAQSEVAAGQESPPAAPEAPGGGTVAAATTVDGSAAAPD
jgi:hypothetical protein